MFWWYARSYRRVWRATITTGLLNPIFYLLSMGILLGKLVDEGNADLGGLTYLEFVAPGLIAALAMQIGTNEGSFPVMAGIRWARTYHAVVATPFASASCTAVCFPGLRRASSPRRRSSPAWRQSRERFSRPWPC